MSLKQHPYFPVILSLLNARDSLYSNPEDLSLLLPEVKKLSDLLTSPTPPATDTTNEDHLKNLSGILVSQITGILTQHDDASRRLDALRLVNLHGFDHIISEHERHHEDEKKSRKELVSSKELNGNEGSGQETERGEKEEVKAEVQADEEEEECEEPDSEEKREPQEKEEGEEEREEERASQEGHEDEEEEDDEDPSRRNLSNRQPDTKRRRTNDGHLNQNYNHHPIPFVMPTPSPRQLVPTGSSSQDEKRPKYRSNHPPWVGSYLKRWLFTHLDDPHPSTLEKEILAKRTGLSRPQISDWLVNARRRILPKATQAMMDRFIQMRFDFDDK